jgi:hypothetical protein
MIALVRETPAHHASAPDGLFAPVRLQGSGVLEQALDSIRLASRRPGENASLGRAAGSARPKRHFTQDCSPVGQASICPHQVKNGNQCV